MKENFFLKFDQNTYSTLILVQVSMLLYIYIYVWKHLKLQPRQKSSIYSNVCIELKPFYMYFKW